MKIIIFAGGAGTRMWPLSRKSFPKQFIRIFEGLSTLELAVKRNEAFGLENIHISTLAQYFPLIEKYLPRLPRQNLVGEPALRNLAPAIGYNLVRLRHQGYKGPLAIIWADHLIEREDNYREALQKGKALVKENPNRVIFVAEKPRSANNNLGWIHVGQRIESTIFKYLEWHYKPPIERCREMFASGEWFWNLGYFIMDLNFALSLYETLQPEMYQSLVRIEESLGTPREKATLEKIYPTLEKISFDNAIAEKVAPEQAVVIKADMGWSDPGTLYALKEALVKNEKENLIKGNVVTLDTEDSLVINEEKEKLLATIGLKGFVVANTKDAILIVPKDQVVKISDLVKSLEENPGLKKYC